MGLFDQIKETSKPANLKDTKAQIEIKDLEKSARRSNQKDDALHYGSMVIMWTLIITYTLALLIFGLNIVAPKCISWLDEQQIKNVQNYVTMGGLGGLGTSLVKSEKRKNRS